jgi:hypothetical protein
LVHLTQSCDSEKLCSTRPERQRRLATQLHLQLEAFASENPLLARRLDAFDPLKTAATFGGLLACPELQSNCLRLEALAHLALACGKGTRKPPQRLISQAFATRGNGRCGRLEDPAEDMFVTSIATPRGNLRILEGIWEAAGFFLQRVVEVAEAMPRGGGYDDIRESIYALLLLSDRVCERAKLVRYQLGNPIPVDELPKRLAGSLSLMRRVVRFSQAEVVAAGISIDHMAEFIFDPGERRGLLGETIGHSTLERRPVAWRNDEFFFVLPTATSAAIRRFVVERMDAAGMRETFVAALANEYANVFSRTPLLGGRIGAPIKFQRTKNGLLAGAITAVDLGRHLSFVLFVDTLEGFEEAGLAGPNPDPVRLADDIDHWIDHAYEAARQGDVFLDGLTLLVGCGVGRATVHYLNNKPRPNWRIEFVSAPDLFTLSWVPGFEPLSLWRLLDAQDNLQSLGVSLENINGLLNLVAWSRSLDGHLVPHGQLSDDLLGEQRSLFIMIEQNSLRELRHEVAVAWDPHVERDVEGRWVSVRKEGASIFEEDRARPFYCSDEGPERGRPLGVYVTDQRPWWCDVDVAGDTPGHFVYERWKMVTVWLQRAVPTLERAINGVPSGPILWRTKFEGDIGHLSSDVEQICFGEARDQISTVIEPTTKTVSLVVGKAFDQAIFNAENVGERALVDALVEGVAKLARRDLSKSEHAAIVGEIVPDHLARQTHAFRTQRFRDYVRRSLPPSPIVIDQDDGAALKLGLGWRVRARSAGPVIQGKTDCISFLNYLVKAVEDELCGDLRDFDRLATIEFLLHNHEAAAVDRDRWSRTAAAVLSLHDDKEATRATMASHDFKLNAVFLATRLLVEIAVCECPLQGGRKPGRLDLSRLMVKASLLFGIGGWSDAIRWDVMEPRLRVTPLGDVHANLGFVDDVITPFGRTTSDARVTDAIEKYAENLDEPTFRASIEDTIEAPFLNAWEEEFGASVDDVRLFVVSVEDLGIRAGKALLKIRKSELLKVEVHDRSIPQEVAERLPDFLTLKSRTSWRDVPPGFDDKDCQPWRFRRRLTVLRKPLIQMDDADDPLIVVAPGILRDSFVYMLGGYHRGDFPDYQLKNRMRVWAGQARDKRGREFSNDVACRLKGLGWEAEVEIKITKLLRQGFERDYGDVDVLAWSPTTGRVLIIECKDVQYRKTYREIAEQLSDFRGELRLDGKPDDLLRHLDRVNLISNHLPQLAKYIGIGDVFNVESHLIFRNPVPMEFALKRMSERVLVHIFDRLGEI